MRCASKAAESASARLCADAEAETTATDVPSVAEETQPVSLGDAGAGHEDTRVFTEYELGVSYSPDTDDGSVSTAIESKPPAKRGMDDALRRSIFGSSDESDEPSPKRRRSRSRDSGANSGVGSPMDTTSQRGASTSVGTSQEERDRNVLRLAPEKKAWMPPKSVMDHLSATTSDRYRTRLFDSSRIHHLDPSAKDYRAEHEFLHRCFLQTSMGVGRGTNKTNKTLYKFEKRTPRARGGAYVSLLRCTKGIDNLKSLYDRAGKTFSGGPSAAQDVSRRTARPDPVRQPSIGSGAPKNPRTGDSRATGRDNSSDVRSRRGGSTAALLDSAGHRESPLMEVEEEERRSPHDHVDRCVPESFFDRVTQGLRDDLEHEQDRRLQMVDTVLKHRAEFAFAQLENERSLTSLRDELSTLVDAHHREHKALCEMLERKGVLHRKKQRTDGTA
uniref:Uncharacterized protein n=1 Tax=Peronospora matthiolae TaxID=2874970 RepID=A0AAV1TGJ6_9STRA